MGGTAKIGSPFSRGTRCPASGAPMRFGYWPPSGVTAGESPGTQPKPLRSPRCRLGCVRREAEEPAIRAPGSCGDSPSRTSVRTAVHPTPMSPSRRQSARTEGRLRPVGWGTGRATTRGEDHARIAALSTDSSMWGPSHRKLPRGDPPGAAARWPPVADGCWKRLSIS
jgi:hypothetical protein